MGCGLPSPGAAGAKSPGPPPVRVRYNDWHRVQVPDLATFTPTAPVSVIISYYEAPEKLALTLAALEQQTYPRELFEVVVVDDGSRVPLEPPRSTALDVRVAHQEDRGYGLGRAWNLGVRLARHDILVFLDGDMLAEAGMIAAHARWHHVAADAVTLGWRRFVPVDSPLDPRMVKERAGSIEELIASRGIEQEEEAWAEAFVRQTHELRCWTPQLYWRVIGCNFGIRRRLYELAGGMQESFTTRSRVDTEFGYRAFAAGGLLVPVRDALSWHLGRYEEELETKEEVRSFQRSALIHLLPQDSNWRAPPGRVFAVPRYVVTLRAVSLPVERALAVTEKLLADAESDLVVRVESGAQGDDLAWLKHQLGPDPRVRIVSRGDALSEFPFASFHVILPGDVDYVDDVVSALGRRLGPRAVVAEAVLPGGRQVSIARTWALHRARRTGRPVAGFGDRVSIMPRQFMASPVRTSGNAGRAHPVAARPGCRGGEWRRRVADLERRWVPPALSLAISALSPRPLLRKSKIARRVWHGLRPNAAATGPPLPPPRVESPLGAEIVTLGPRACAVFEASARVAREPGAHADVVVADTREEAARAGAPAVALPEAPALLSVPAFDPRVDNPVHWQYRAGDEVGALGPVEWLPRGVKAHQALPPRPAKAMLRGYHHIEDVAAYHRDAFARAGELARLAANGAVVHLADGGPGLAPLLGEELHALMTGAVHDLDLDAREWLSVRMRRLALRDHSLQSRARQICERVLSDPPRPPLVSILLPTHRPGFLAHALSSVARQTWPRLELVLGLHGDGFDPGEVERRVRELKCPVKVVKADRSLTLGAVLNLLTEGASGSFLTKMDDDDLYDAEHIRDLMLAYEYSGAALIGRVLRYFWFERSGQTVRMRFDPGEWYQGHLAGSSLLFSRRTLEEAGGWIAASRSEDRRLIERVKSLGGAVYQCHGAGFAMTRHGFDHAWDIPDADLLARAQCVSEGWDPALACFEQGITLPAPVSGGVAS